MVQQPSVRRRLETIRELLPKETAEVDGLVAGYAEAVSGRTDQWLWDAAAVLGDPLTWLDRRAVDEVKLIRDEQRAASGDPEHLERWDRAEEGLRRVGRHPGQWMRRDAPRAALAVAVEDVRVAREHTRASELESPASADRRGLEAAAYPGEVRDLLSDLSIQQLRIVAAELPQHASWFQPERRLWSRTLADRNDAAEQVSSLGAQIEVMELVGEGADVDDAQHEILAWRRERLAESERALGEAEEALGGVSQSEREVESLRLAVAKERDRRQLEAGVAEAGASPDLNQAYGGGAGY